MASLAKKNGHTGLVRLEFHADKEKVELRQEGDGGKPVGPLYHHN